MTTTTGRRRTPSGPAALIAMAVVAIAGVTISIVHAAATATAAAVATEYHELADQWDATQMSAVQDECAWEAATVASLQLVDDGTPAIATAAAAITTAGLTGAAEGTALSTALADTNLTDATELEITTAQHWSELAPDEIESACIQERMPSLMHRADHPTAADVAQLQADIDQVDGVEVDWSLIEQRADAVDELYTPMLDALAAITPLEAFTAVYPHADQGTIDALAASIAQAGDLHGELSDDRTPAHLWDAAAFWGLHQAAAAAVAASHTQAVAAAAEQGQQFVLQDDGSYVVVAADPSWTTSPGTPWTPDTGVPWVPSDPGTPTPTQPVLPATTITNTAAYTPGCNGYYANLEHGSLLGAPFAGPYDYVVVASQHPAFSSAIQFIRCLT